MSRLFQRIAGVCLAPVFALAVQAQVVINEIHCDPPVKTEQLEFIELHNAGSEPADLSGWSFSRGLTFEFPAGTVIPAGGYALVAEHPAKFAAKFGLSALGPWEGRLENHGEQITLVNAQGAVVDDVDYQLGFPWPTVGEPPGYSMELVNPAFDNDLGGSWRRSVRGNPSAEGVTFIAEESAWKYKKGTEEPSSPPAAWRESAFDDGGWASGPAPIGYDSNNDQPLGTDLEDMRDNYTSVFLRKKFHLEDPAAVGALKLYALYDDGFKVWINGELAASANISSSEVPYNGTSGPARESADYEEFAIGAPSALLVPGENTIAIQAHNSHISNSSDFYMDIRLVGELGSPGAGPTPGARNAVFADNIAPQLRQAAHSPERPASGEPVLVTIKATDPDGIESIDLSYQVVAPGNYIELNEAAYETTWTSLPMRDDGTNGDLLAGDSTYSALIPGAGHRHLVRYRIHGSDSGGRSIRAPYLDDPVPNFAYFVYDGVPAWQGAIQPGSGDPERGETVTYPGEEMARLPVYHLIAKNSSVEDATWYSGYAGSDYPWWGTLVYEGKVYDHIRYRARGGVWRYAMGKNMWKFDFNRGHDFQARDNYGDEYATPWRKLNLGANIQQGDYLHRGEQGMFESVGFRLFNLTGVESPKTHWATFRVIDDASETGDNQYNGDFWGLYLAVEQMDGRFLDEHGLPDGNLYKMEAGTGELNNQGRAAPSDKSDLNQFLSTYRGSAQPLEWWRENLDTEKYFSYQAIVQGIHHYDICDGKNYFYYHNPETGQWSVLAWDLDLTWANNMYRDCAGADDLKNRVLASPILSIEHKNRLREIRDLLFNPDEAHRLIDEYAGIVKGQGAVNILGADRAMWDYNPVMVSGLVNQNKAGHGRFYEFSYESGDDPSLRGSFDAGVRIMKNYVTERSAFIDSLAQDPAIPSRPSITYTGPEDYALNKITFQSSSYAGESPFAAMAWRVGEIRAASPGVNGIYEIEPLWHSGELDTLSSELLLPPDILKVGHAYRARVRMKDASGRWSHWSDPVEFVAGEPDHDATLAGSLRITELMYNPIQGSDFEYIELHNTSSVSSLDLAGLAFTDGADFVFPAGSTLAPGQYALVIKFAPSAAGEFRQLYNISVDIPVFGPLSGNLNNDGEQITLKTAAAGTELISFTFSDRNGWPIAPDGTGHSLVPLASALAGAQDSLEYGRNWRASAYIGGSPGSAEPGVESTLLINEIAAHTEYSDPANPGYDSNDWIEIINAGTETALQDYYLSDNADELKKWAVPSSVLQAGARIVFDEVTGFHNPITAGFGLDQAGEEVYLSHLPSSGPGRVVDAVRLGGIGAGTSFGRYPDAGDFLSATEPTPNSANTRLALTVAITEIMFHPEDSSGGTEPESLEYVELYNAGAIRAPLATASGPWRIAGGVDFSFPAEAVIDPGEAVLLVSFDPANAAAASQFTAFYGLDAPKLYGPYTGRLSNSGERVGLEKPDAPDQAGDPLAWVIVDEVVYFDQSPWPGADGTGDSLQRDSLQQSASDPSNWTAAAPSPGAFEPAAPADSDSDGLPDDWELAHGLDPNSAADALGDHDLDGFNNSQEFFAGTDPNDPGSALVLSVSLESAAPVLSFDAVPGRTYSLLAAEDVVNGPWMEVEEFTGASGLVSVPYNTEQPFRYFRLVTPAVP